MNFLGVGGVCEKYHCRKDESQWRAHASGSSVINGISGCYCDRKAEVNLELKTLYAAIAAREVPCVSMVEHSLV